MKLVYTLVLGTSAARREGSSPFIPTKLFMAEKILYQSDEAFDGPSSETLLGSLSVTVEGQATQWLTERYHPISADLVWALEDLKGRSQILVECIDPSHDHGLSATLELATQMGMGAIGSADTITELADAISRTADHIQG